MKLVWDAGSYKHLKSLVPFFPVTGSLRVKVGVRTLGELNVDKVLTSTILVGTGPLMLFMSDFPSILSCQLFSGFDLWLVCNLGAPRNNNLAGYLLQPRDFPENLYLQLDSV